MQKDTGKLIEYECDSCGEVIEFEYDNRAEREEIKELFKDEGWVWRKVDGEWTCLCGDCK